MTDRRRGAPASSAWGRRAGQVAPPALLIGGALVGWQLAVMVWRIERYLLPAPLDILRAALQARGLLGQHIWQTVQETLLGFAVALISGLLLGLAVDASPWFRRAVYPLLVVSQTVPIIAVAPLLVIWLGYTIWPKIIVVGLVCFFPIVVNTADGLRSADPELMALLRSMGAGRGDLFRIVRVPGALPAIFSGVKVAITYSVVGAIMGEWVGASKGLGIYMLRATNSFRTDWVFASIAITALLSLFLFGAVALTERLWLRWYFGAARQEQWEEV